MAKDRLGGKKTLNVGGFLNEFEKDDVKRQIDIVTLFEHFGVRLTKKGKSHTGCCPWHDDKTPSLSVDREKGLYNCFGCGESGDHFSLVMKMKGCEFKEALARLKKLIGKVDVTPAALPGKQQPAGTKKPPVTKPIEKPVTQTGEKKIRDRKSSIQPGDKTESVPEETAVLPVEVVTLLQDITAPGEATLLTEERKKRPCDPGT